MHPDGTDLLIFILLFSITAALSFQAGRVLANEESRELRVLGFSNAAAGVFSGFLVAFSFTTFWCGARLNAWGLWLILVLAVALPLLIVPFALGLCIDKKADAQRRFWSCGIGTLVTLLAKLLFRAARLTAQALVTEEEVLSLMDDVEEQELIDESQREMITNIFELDDVTASDIMTHRTELVSVEEKTPVSDVVSLALKFGFSRMPVYRKTVDNVIGIVYAKDLLSLLTSPENMQEPVSNYGRTAMFVPETRKARELLIDFKHKRTQIAIVVDEYGGTSGLVSMEDILEEIVGNIQDEYDNEDELLVPLDDGFIADGSLDLEDVFDAFNLLMPEAPEAEFDSVGGLITDILGRIPTLGEDISLTYCGINFHVIEVGERRIIKVKCTKALQNIQLKEEESDD